MDAKTNKNAAGIPPSSVLWFGHAETLLPLVIKLGLFNESTAVVTSATNGRLVGGHHLDTTGLPSRLLRLRPSDSLPVRNLFRASHIIPFAANIVFKLLHCPTSTGGWLFLPL